MKAKLIQIWTQLRQHPELDSAWIRWGLVIAGGVILSTWMIEPYLDWRVQQADIIVAKHKKVAKLIALQASKAKWEQALTVAKKNMQEFDESFIEADSYTLAQQQMNQLVQQQIKRYELKVMSKSLQESETNDLGEKIGLQFQLSGDIHAIIEFIDSIAHNSKLFVLEQLQISQGRTVAILRITLVSYSLQKLTATKNPED